MFHTFQTRMHQIQVILASIVMTTATIFGMMAMFIFLG